MRESEPNPIRVLLVDASSLTLALLKRALATVTSIQVVGGVRSAQEALLLVAEQDPHVICVGLHLLDMEAHLFVRKTMERYPRPMLVVGASALQEGESDTIFQMFEVGALDLFLEPLAWRSEDIGQFSLELTSKIRLMARLDRLPDFTCSHISVNTTLPLTALPELGMVVIGAGLGGVNALREVLAALPVGFSVPILCIVHLHPVLQSALPHWLGAVTHMPVQAASHGEIPMPGSVYLAPAGHHLLVDSHGRLATLLSTAGGLSTYGQRGDMPSIMVAMESVASHLGTMVVGVLLSGTGEDGARGLESIARVGGYTLAMDEASALVFDLPARLLEMGTVRHLLPCSVIARALLALLGQWEVEHPCGTRSNQVDETVAQAALPAVPGEGGAAAVAPPETWRTGEGILVVEDSPTQAFKLKRFLQESGFVVAVAKDGLDGLEKARVLRPRLVLSDVSMPRMDGFEMCRTLKKDPLCRHIPVMLLTALTNPEEILEGLSVGADNYLTKPWEGAYLLECLQRVLATVAATEAEPVRAEKGIELVFAGRQYTITSSRRQVLDLLLSTYQKAVRQNKELMDNHLELKMLNSRLVDQAARLEMSNQNLQLEIAERKKVEEAQTVTLNELSAANQELGDFAYVISHDLKAPSRAIGSLTSWLLSDYADALGGEGRDLVKLLQRRADRLNGLIDALMLYVRVSRLNETLQEVDLNRLVPQVIKGIKPPEEMEVVLENSLPTIRFEPRRAEQLFHSLIENAVRFMDKPLGVVQIACVGEVMTAEGTEACEETGFSSVAVGAGEWWQFRVKDNGPGIDAAYFEKIFGVFQTLQARDEQETSGMGLALARKIVHKFGGRIWVTSQLGVGSAFCFTLPKNP
ncbi:MAG: response regulator [Magnetococcales bacterium]|nr:response regulator [Magnetococcales bacterium]